MDSNGVAVAELAGQTVVNIDELAGRTVRLEVPGRVDGVPPVRAARSRRVEWPDKQHYAVVRGGASTIEVMWLEAVDAQFREMVDDGVSSLKANFWRKSQWATFLADRVVEHNFEHGPDDPVALGLDFTWEMNQDDVLYLLRMMQRDVSHYTDPNAARPSSTTSPSGDSSP